MKNLIIILTIFIPSLGFAKEGTSITIDHDQASVFVANMSCMIFPGKGAVEKRSYLVVGRGRFGDSENFLFLGTQSLQLRHRNASQLGCDIEAMDKVSDKSHQSFGFVVGAPITVTKTTRIFRAPNGRCYERFDEKVETDIGEGIVVTSEESEVKPSQECD